ncbi:DUF4912 domain-containing protein [Arcobacter arenosus]|uniref:DUF4912 domain-containing protein n=1 Tax=Arcobacter arenosus TaxID=2576037 RepID=A0A5R8Y1X1_9BACT|nr:DUF4912 domain-containing protein [Arcobacter arenosus]TLP38465.1 DUF4912 domain-containing protein [Arcobacter arenosus]
MNPKADDLVKESMKLENDFSSSSHVIDTLVKEGEPVVQEYKIPDRYNKDTLRILMVNTEKYFVYWEVSDQTLAKNNIDLGKDKLYFKVFNTDNQELYSFESSFALGKYYVKRPFENMNVYVKVGLTKEDDFIELITSNTVHTFSSQVNLPSSEDEVWIRKKMGWTEVIRSTIEHSEQGVSSAKYIEEMEKIKHFIEEVEEKQKFSSSSVVK